MKTSVYINADNERLLKGIKGKTTSSIINKALEMYFNSEMFDCSKYRNNEDFRLAVIRLNKGVIKLLKGLAKNFDNKVVVEFLMYLIVRELGQQTNRPTFPDRLYIGYKHISAKIEQLIKVRFRKNDRT